MLGLSGMLDAWTTPHTNFGGEENSVNYGHFLVTFIGLKFRAGFSGASLRIDTHDDIWHLQALCVLAPVPAGPVGKEWYVMTTYSDCFIKSCFSLPPGRHPV